MPRSGKGGPRQGAPGQAYANRSDLTAPVSAQQLGGTANSPGAPPPANGTPGNISLPQDGGGDPFARLQEMIGKIPADKRPGAGPGLAAPSAYPEEPETAGMATGPGPGPEVLGAYRPNQPTQDMMALAKYLPVLEHLQSRAGSTKARTLLRMLRASIPLEARELLSGPVPPEPGEQA